MEELVTGTIDNIFSGADKEVLVDVVRLIQKQGLNSSRGNWKEFLNSYDRKLGDSLSDPSKRSADVLTAFLKSFNQTKDLMFIGKIFRHFRDQRAFEMHIKNSLNEETPEQRLVRLTMEHPQYRRNYYCDAYNTDWIVVPLGDMSKVMKSSSMLSVDCEMVLCNDGTEEVVKVCAVDNKLNVKLNKIVNPNKSISDYRTEITGVSAKDLEGVTCSLVDIQGSMKKLLKHGTILVGHSAHNDLRALKIAHHRVIDTSYIFKYSEVRLTYTPSLNSLCKAVLGYEVRKEGEPHDCRIDAEAAMKLVLAKLGHGFDEPLKIDKRVPDFSHAMLLHKIPVEVPCQELKKGQNTKDNIAG
ncbi:small RNA degrading nuclease 3-like isoform X2 [Phalaenopsis equestris]|uniref:small RNA degrading nuclease 3-like isoform X2 n=1 Tax=Phalaenopsis equestris TaxID=78828 RepID=UPI0009E48D74|nr:small RNA degrading nuclease 3-like isoform X2 [Phalaenopsis equestris]